MEGIPLPTVETTRRETPSLQLSIKYRIIYSMQQLVYHRVRWLLCILPMLGIQLQASQLVFVDQFQLARVKQSEERQFLTFLKESIQQSPEFSSVTFYDSLNFFRSKSVPLSEPCTDIACSAFRADKLFAPRAIGGRIEKAAQGFRIRAVLIDVPAQKAIQEKELEFVVLDQQAALTVVQSILPSITIPAQPSTVPRPAPVVEVTRDRRAERRNLMIGMIGGSLFSAIGLAIIANVVGKEDDPETSEITVEW